MVGKCWQLKPWYAFPLFCFFTLMHNKKCFRRIFCLLMLSALTIPNLSLMFMLYSQNPQGESSHMQHGAEREEIWAHTAKCVPSKNLNIW